MQNEIRCRRCDTIMTAGYLADHGDHQAIVQARWIEGAPEEARWLGMRTGSVQTEDRPTYPLAGYRCPHCFSVELFAPPTEAGETLLRPASGADSADAAELLRGSRGAD